jgi:uncharacterized repeat protein (TIGR01451 family)
MKLVALLLIIVIQLVFIPVPKARAATTPGLGQAASFVILSNTYTNTVGGTTLNGDLGYTTGPAVAPTVNGSTFSPPASKYSQAGIDQAAALADLNAQSPCDFTYAPGAIDLASDVTTPDGVGQFTPGIYCIDGAASIGGGGTITLTGAGTYIFRMTGALTTSAGSIVALAGGASACDVFWTPGAATTLGANSTFIGTDIDDSGITIGSTVTWTGRALAFGGTVSTDTDTISSTSCTAATATSSSSSSSSSSDDEEDEEDEDAEIKVTKKADPAALLSGPGTVTYTYKVTNPGDVSLRNVSVKDNKCSPVVFVSGDNNNSSRLGLDETWIYTCTKTVSQTETNKATARGAGSANGDWVDDTDTATVTVSVPGLPNAGVGPDENNTSWRTTAGTFAGILAFLVFTQRRERLFLRHESIH